jgi:nitroreductase
MDALETMLTRVSPVRLQASAPPAEVLDRAVRAANAAPDHGLLRPWRFLTISGDDRLRFGDVLAEALSRRQPRTGEAELDRERARALRAPLIVVAAAQVKTDHPKIPEIEQILATGAAVQNLILSVHASGYGAMWKTGPAARDDHVKQALGLATTDVIVGFIYIGTPDGPLRPKPRPDAAEVVQKWPT